jgi:hypothetical protein
MCVGAARKLQEKEALGESKAQAEAAVVRYRCARSSPANVWLARVADRRGDRWHGREVDTIVRCRNEHPCLKDDAEHFRNYLHPIEHPVRAAACFMLCVARCDRSLRRNIQLATATTANHGECIICQR